jgi:hypothetical protein
LRIAHFICMMPKAISILIRSWLCKKVEIIILRICKKVEIIILRIQTVASVVDGHKSFGRFVSSIPGHAVPKWEIFNEVVESGLLDCIIVSI